MSRLLLFMFVCFGTLGFSETLIPPASPYASEGKSVYSQPAPPVDVVEEGCVQKEDQNTTGHGSAQ